METIEMDLMQAQIGELTTEVTSVSGRVKKLEDNGGGGGGSAPMAVKLLTTTDGNYTPYQSTKSSSEIITALDTAPPFFYIDYVDSMRTVEYIGNFYTQIQIIPSITTEAVGDPDDPNEGAVSYLDVEGNIHWLDGGITLTNLIY